MEEDIRKPCAEHVQSMQLISEIASDVKWLSKVGGFWIRVTGAALVLALPLLVSFLVYVSKLETRLTTIEHSVKEHIEASE